MVRGAVPMPENDAMRVQGKFTQAVHAARQLAPAGPPAVQQGSVIGCPPSLLLPSAYACAAMRQTRHAARAAAERLSAGTITGQKGSQSGGMRSHRMRSLTLSATANFSDAALQARVVALLRLLRTVSYTEHKAAADSSNMRQLPCQQRTPEVLPVRVPCKYPVTDL